MAKKKERIFAQRTCSECRRATWVLDKPEQRDLKGRPLILRCPLRKFAVLRSENACEEFMQ